LCLCGEEKYNNKDDEENMKKLPIGQSDFRNIITENYYYIDKSLLIKEVIDDDALVMLLPRPRRFGKTVNLSMLRYFFEKVDNEQKTKRLFRGLAIEQEDVFHTHCGQYPVIFLTFKNIKSTDLESALKAIKKIVSEEFKRHKYLLDSNNRLDEIEKKHFAEILALNADTTFFEDGLKDLSIYLFRYYNQKPVILIDEYDTPIHTAFVEGYYPEIVAFFRSFLGAGLKDNPYIFKGVLTGILRVARESIFSDLNNLGVYSLLRPEYCDKFGFTERDLKNMLKDYQIEHTFEEVNAWYNGYVFGETIMYNPWSILNFVASKDRISRTYWANTSSNRILKDIIGQAPAIVKVEFQDLLQDIPIKKELDENIVFTELTNNERAVYSFLVFSGYLKAFAPEEVNYRQYHSLLIPNQEVKQIFEDVILLWINESYENRKLQLMLHALVDNDIPTFEEILSDFVLSTLSYFDTPKQDVERVYQAFLLGMLINLSSAYEINSNKESGFGRSDISIIPKDIHKRAIIMELKKIGLNETKDTALTNALKQIEEKQYETEIRKRGIQKITKLGVTFDGKRVWVQTGEEEKA
jgi:hypothetical protein